MPKRFTLSEARQLLPQVNRLIRDAVECKSEYQNAERAIQAFSGQITLMGGMVVDRSPVLEARARREHCAERLKQTLENIHEIGCEVKDLDTGLIDFPSRFRGQEVYLCWKLGEPDINHWHSVHEGFAGRKPIDQDFIDNHEGDRPH